MLLPDEQMVVKWLSDYGALHSRQVEGLLHHKKPGVAAKILRNLRRGGLVHDLDGGYIALDPAAKPDERLITAVWVLLQFIEKVYCFGHYPADYPAQIFFLKENTGYEVLVLYPGEEHMTRMLQPPDEESDLKYIIVVASEDMIPAIPHPARPCLYATVNRQDRVIPDVVFYGEEVAAVETAHTV